MCLRRQHCLEEVSIDKKRRRVPTQGNPQEAGVMLVGGIIVKETATRVLGPARKTSMQPQEAFDFVQERGFNSGLEQ